VAYSNNAQIELTRESAELERRLIPITQEMNDKPLRVNTLTWVINRESAEESASFLTEYCQYLADWDEFRPNSTADCVKALFTNTGRKPTKLSKVTGCPVTDSDTLLELAAEGSSLAGIIPDARSAITRLGQLRAWKSYAEYGSVQATWDSLGTPHGRYTSDSPCLNNRIKPIRETIEPDDGYSFLSLDLNQAEYVTWASLAGGPVLSKLFQEGRDFHAEMARDVQLCVPGWDLHGEDPRAAGKTLNFALLYQMQPHTLAGRLCCGIETATKIISAYYNRVPTAALYIKAVLAAARNQGYIETLYGRRRYCPEYQTATGGREEHEVEKTLFNHLIAGTAAEFLKVKQVKTWEALREEGFTTNHIRLVLNNYDELVWHVRDDLLKEIQGIAEEIFKEQELGFLPFGVGIGVGKTWAEASKG